MRRFLLLAVPALLLGSMLLVAAADAADEVPVPVPAQPAFLKRQPIRAQPGFGAQPAKPQLTDEEALKQASLDPQDGKQLLDYLKQRTLSDVDQGKIGAIIARFGGDDFEDRVKATEEVERFGPAAIGPLKKAEKDGDPEIAYRARVALKKMEKVPHSATAAAAVRAIVKLKPEGAAAALIAFLPLADTESVSDAIREALVSLAVKDGKAEPALVAALNDVSPIRRAAAYVALTEGGEEGKAVRIKDSYPALREAVMKDTDAEAKFTGLWSLAMVTRDRDYLPALIELIPKLGRGRIWQLEELLLLIAGTHPKDGRFLRSSESLTKASQAWLGWWKEKGEQFDFAKFEYKPRIAGITDIIEVDARGYGQGRIVSLGSDLKEKWRIQGVNNPTDMKITPEGHVWIVESNNNIVSEWDSATGKRLGQRVVHFQPMNLDLLPDGGMVVAARSGVFQWDKAGKQVWAHNRQNNDIMAGRRLPNGDTIFVTTQQQGGPNCFRVDSKGVDTKKTVAVGWILLLQCMQALEDDKILLSEYDNKNPGSPEYRIAEYDLKTGKRVWKYDCPQSSAPSSAQRLPNGNTLIALMNHNRAIEVDPSGEIVWEYQAKDGLRVGRISRR